MLLLYFKSIIVCISFLDIMQLSSRSCLFSKKLIKRVYEQFTTIMILIINSMIKKVNTYLAKQIAVIANAWQLVINSL